MTEDEIRVFHDSFDRCMRQEQRFFDLFYEDFLASSPEVRRKFRHTDFDHQKRALRIVLMTFLSSAARKEHDFSLLHGTALRHSRHGAAIEPDLYALWLASLLRTAAACDPYFDETAERAWRQVFQPAIDYIVSHY